MTMTMHAKLRLADWLASNLRGFADADLFVMNERLRVFVDEAESNADEGCMVLEVGRHASVSGNPEVYVLAARDFEVAR